MTLFRNRVVADVTRRSPTVAGGTTVSGTGVRRKRRHQDLDAHPGRPPHEDEGRDQAIGQEPRRAKDHWRRPQKQGGARDRLSRMALRRHQPCRRLGLRLVASRTDRMPFCP